MSVHDLDDEDLGTGGVAIPGDEEDLSEKAPDGTSTFVWEPTDRHGYEWVLGRIRFWEHEQEVIKANAAAQVAKAKRKEDHLRARFGPALQRAYKEEQERTGDIKAKSFVFDHGKFGWRKSTAQVDVDVDDEEALAKAMMWSMSHPIWDNATRKNIHAVKIVKSFLVSIFRKQVQVNKKMVLITEGELAGTEEEVVEIVDPKTGAPLPFATWTPAVDKFFIDTKPASEAGDSAKRGRK